jgi:hypothetical protein
MSKSVGLSGVEFPRHTLNAQTSASGCIFAVFTRLTNAHSKTLANMQAAVTLYIAFYNFCRVHASLKVTPAMQSGIANHVWSIQELLG